MIDVNKVLEMHAETVQRWHLQPIDNPYDGIWGLICRQHAYNFELWHQEDIARSPDASDATIAQVKREIDRLNQARNDYIEKVDDWITAELVRRDVEPAADARQNTETPGSAIDRLSIMALRLYHYEEQLQRDDADDAHLAKVQQRIELCRQQKHDLSRSLQQLLDGIAQGQFVHKTYRQMKMYNDPTLNPYLYGKQQPARGG
ncbi:MAG: DUF4254 domain-containing protein [Planctomycetota bacterium]|nr:MAG: DUF4254 domain-containing protein [Planctomycetota bacterium]